MAYINPRIAACMDPERVKTLEALFQRLDDVDLMLKNAVDRFVRGGEQESARAAKSARAPLGD